MTPHALRSRSVFALAALLAVCGSASADVEFFGVTDTSLVRFNMTLQTVSVVAPLTSGGALTGLTDCDFDAGGVLWATRVANLGGFPPTTISAAYQINTSTGVGTQQGNFGSSASLGSLGFRSSNSTFYSINNSGGTTTAHLVTDNLVAGTVTTVGGAPHGLPGGNTVEAVAFGPGGLLYGIWQGGAGPPFGGNDYKLVTFNIATGAGSVIGSIAPGLVFSSLRFDSAGVAYTVESNSGNVYTISLGTGQGTVLFAGGAAAAGTRGMAFIVPVPGSIGVLGLGAMLAARRRRR